MMATQEHWDAIYRNRATEDLGWYEPSPSTLDLVQRYTTQTDPVIDIGGGDSRMVDELVAADYEEVTVLDLSSAALERSRLRLGPAAEAVTWIRADITDWEPTSTWSLWHDRAAFHFLTNEDDRRRYVETARRAIPRGGHLVIATFAPDGPEQCAGLPVQRYHVDALAAVFAPGFRILEHHRLHAGAIGVGDTRPYIALVLERR